MKLWGGRFTKEENQLVHNFNASITFDQKFYHQDIQGSIAHVTMLAKQAIITDAERDTIISALKEICSDIESGKLQITEEYEDIHSFVESVLIERTGDTGKKLHTGRSRNDQVALDMKLYTRDEVLATDALVKELMTTLLDLMKEHIDTYMPGFTHLQKAQPVTLAHHIGAYFEMFKRDRSRLHDIHERMNYCPLGAGALAGTSYPLDREYTASLLGFTGPTLNSMDSVSDRDYLIEYLSALSTIMMHLSRFCEEIILWNSNEYRFIELDDAYSTGSSIMPQKKNPDIAELIRGKTGRVYGALTSLLTTMKGLPLAYNKDILDKAGIDPSTLTGPDAIKEAFETIDSKKDELGLTAVVGYAAEPVNLYWSTGNHLFGTYLDEGLDRDDTTYIDMLNDGGKVDEDRLTDFANFVGLLNQYSDPALLVSGTYDQQILNFSSGKYAFVTQGSWIGATMVGDDADAYKEAGNFEVGMIPYAFEDGQDTILTSSPSWWSVYKDGNVEAAEAFLQWLTTDEAQEVLVKEAGFVSPFKSCTIVGDDPFAQTITDYQKAEKTSAWHWSIPGFKEGIAQNYTGQVFADYASGSLDEAGFVKTMQQVLESAYAN